MKNNNKEINRLRAILDNERRDVKTSLYRVNCINSALEHSEALGNIGRVTCAKNILNEALTSNGCIITKTVADQFGTAGIFSEALLYIVTI